MVKRIVKYSWQFSRDQKQELKFNVDAFGMWQSKDAASICLLSKEYTPCVSLACIQSSVSNSLIWWCFQNLDPLVTINVIYVILPNKKSKHYKRKRLWHKFVFCLFFRPILSRFMAMSDNKQCGSPGSWVTRLTLRKSAIFLKIIRFFLSERLRCANRVDMFSFHVGRTFHPVGDAKWRSRSGDGHLARPGHRPVPFQSLSSWWGPLCICSSGFSVSRFLRYTLQ